MQVNKPQLADFAHKDRFELKAYLSHLFTKCKIVDINQIRNKKNNDIK